MTLPGKVLRGGVVAMALALAAVTLAQRSAERSARQELAAAWQTTGAAARLPLAARRAQGDSDVLAGRLALARALLAEGLQPRRLAGLPPAEAAAEAARLVAGLEQAAGDAAAALRVRPAAWEAALVLGGTRLLAAWRRGDDEVYRNPGPWQEPLRRARALAPGAAEPGRLLASGQLSSWHALSDAQRDEARALLREGFRDPATLAQLLPAWAAVAGDERQLGSVLPPGSEPWRLLQDAYRGQGDWERFCAARKRWLPLFGRELEARLAAAEHRLDLGDRAGGAGELLAVATTAQPDLRFAPLFARAMTQLPAGPVSPGNAEALARWLRWAVPLWLLGQEPLPAEVFRRVAGLSAELPPARAAIAALAAGDLERAEVWERRSERLWSEDWAPYAVAKAAALLDRGHVAEAAATFTEVHRSYHGRWAYRRVRHQLAVARGEAEAAADGEGLAAEWPATAWLFEAGEASLEAVPSREAPGLELALDVVPAAGAAVEVALDGLVVGCFPARAGVPLRLAAPVTAAPHYLTLRQLAGERVAPGAVRLLPRAAATP